MLGILKPCKGGTPIPLTKPKLLVGRKNFCDITLAFPNVSSRHSELELKDGFWFVRDLKSTNGTYIDGKECEYDCAKPNSELRFARHRFTLEYEAKGEAPKVEPTHEEIVSEGLLNKAGFATEDVSKATSDGPAHRGQLFPVGGGSPIPLNADHLLVGRDRGCGIRLKSNTVSSRHCELEFMQGYWLVRDMDSHNGTFVNGKKIEQCWLLPNAVLQISNLRFKVLYRPTEGAPVPTEEGVFSFTRSLLERAGLKRRR